MIHLLLIYFIFSCSPSEKHELNEKENIYNSVIAEDIINASDLNKFIYQENTVFIDVRGSEEFKNSHLKNSFNVWRPDIRNTDTTIEGLIAQKFKIELLLSSFGVNDTTQIIVYDSKGNPDAARLWWILKYYGHKNTSILNGGLTAVNSSFITSKNTQLPKQKHPYTFANEINNTLYASLNEVLKATLDTSKYYILDTRSSTEFSGEKKKGNAGKAGRIPNSFLIDYSENIDYKNNQKFKSFEQLNEIYKDVPKDKIIITYCQSGVRSALTTFVLKNILKYDNVKNYDGSWLEWSNDSTLLIIQDSIL